MASVVIIHNIPISYKHLLFIELARGGLDFEVLFIASGSIDRLETPDLKNAPYRSRVGFHGSYEAVPYLGTAKFVWRALREIRPEAVIISGWYGVGAWTAKLWSVLHRCRSILWAESNEFDHPRMFWKEWIKAAFLRGFVAAQVYGITNARYLLKLGFSSKNIWSKRAIADVKLFNLAGRSTRPHNSKKVILFVGRFAPEKNLEFVLETFNRLSSKVRSRLLLRFVGYGSLETLLLLKSQSLGLNDNVEFAGSRKHDQLPEVYHSADVLLLPSISETWGLTVNEGMLCGLPAIVSDQCGCAVDLVNPDTGWTFDPKDSSGLARILERISEMPLEDLRALGKNAAALAREYSPENCAKVVVECLAKAVPSGPITR